MIKHIVYLHGFASSPNSNKANHIIKFFKNKDIKISVPDLNCGDFSNVTITKMLSVISKELSELNEEFIIVGSSLGGYLATLYVENSTKLPDQMLLLAPGFNLYTLFRNWLGEFGISEWEKNGRFNFMHYAYNKELPLSYEFYKDLKKHTPYPHIKKVPAHIIHGRLDNVVPLENSYEFIKQNPHTTIEVVDDTHELPSSMEFILRWIEKAIA